MLTTLNSHKVSRIHSIETFGTVDGPGIRYVIFFQRCNLKCKYCHNRDLWDKLECNHYTVDYLLNDIESYAPFFKNSGGGVTVTGGEPLLQAKFITKLFKKLKQRGIHTALDTAGALPLNDTIVELLEYTDLVLLDIKHIDPEQHKYITGKTNEHTLALARWLGDHNKKLWVRHVIVPGLTDDLNDIRRLAQFVKTVPTVEKMELLPYHKMGEHKWEFMDLEYPLKDTPEPTRQSIEDIQKCIESYGIEATFSR